MSGNVGNDLQPEYLVMFLSFQVSLNGTNDIYYEILKERRPHVEILKIRREKRNWLR
jgi:hypothetical protein